jgi:hypothetical protein
MKQLFTVLVAIALVASFVSAQDITGVGPKVQLNMATLGGDDIPGLPEAKMTALIGFGGFLTMNIIPELDLQGEVMFDQKGAEGDPDYSLTLGYISINALAKYPIPVEGSDIKPAVFLGPSIGILMSATGNPGSVDVKDDYESLDYGIIIGAGATIPVGDGSIVADVRYNLGLANILKTGGSVYSKTNQVISLSVGYAFKP